MKNVIDEVARLIMYKGPSISELITDALNENKKISITEENDLTYLKISFCTAYKTSVKDLYIFNTEKELIKQEIEINNKVKVIFDKYEEAKKLLRNLNTNLIAS